MCEAHEASSERAADVIAMSSVFLFSFIMLVVDFVCLFGFRDDISDGGG